MIRKLIIERRRKPLKSLIAVLCLIGYCAVSSAAEPRVNVLEIVGKSQEATSDLLDDRGSCIPWDQGTLCQYKKAGIEILFIEGKADWITVYGLEDVEFSQYALKHVGLRPAPPHYRNPFVMHWQFHHGLAIVSVYSNGKTVDHIQVRAYTEK